MNVTKSKYFIAMLKNSKSENSKKIGLAIEHGPHWINFIINFYFHK